MREIHRPSRRNVMLGMSASGFAALCGCSRPPSPSRTPNVVHLATTAGLNLTMSQLLRQQNFLEQYDLKPDVVAMADGSKILGGIYSGSIDISPMSGFGQIFPAVERGADIKIINAATLIPMLALFSGKSNVRALQDLPGKVVGTGALGSLDHQLTVTLLRKYGVDANAVRFVSIGSNTDIFKGVMAGTVDAGTGPAAYIDDAESVYNVHLLQNGNMSLELKEFTYQAGWTSKRVIDVKRDVLVRVLAAYLRLFRFVEQPSAQEPFLKARRTIFPNSPEREHLAEWRFLQNFKPFSLDLMISPERVRYMQQINLDFKIQKDVLPFDQVTDMSLAQDALKLVS